MSLTSSISLSKTTLELFFKSFFVINVKFSLQLLVNDVLESSLEMNKKLFIEITGVKDINDFLNEEEGKYIVPINKTEEELFYLSLKYPLISELIKFSRSEIT